ncbi:MAG: penicillin-binding protein 2 [Spirochaetes bacterium RBG_13_51_14]|nr:MAG: penicillin-binding protein 2 [Spirochaetes bacterium RBG_13_51_14]
MLMQSSLRAKLQEAFRVRMYFYMAVAAVVFAVLLLQLMNLQLIQGKEYAVKARINMESNIPIPAGRGDIYDRNFREGEKNVVVVSNRPSFNLTTIPANFKSKKKLNEILDLLARLLNIDKDEIVNEISNSNPWERVILKEDVEFDTIVKIASHQNRFPNIDWEDASVRVYNFSEMFAHVIGYVGSINREEYRRLKSEGYKHYQKIGKSGIEKQYDRLLRGRDGYVRRIVDVRQRTEGEEVGQRPSAGNNLVLTIDYNIQSTIYEAMKDLKGAAIALKPATGEIIALVSKPDFDPNVIISKNNARVIKQLQTDNDRPFLNRMIQSKYPPASTFKLITTVAALETEKAKPEKTYYCPGKYTLKGYIDHDFYDYDAHGTVDLYWAIAKSCSVYFYQLGLLTGPTDIIRYAEDFGLNQKSGIDIPGEVPGFVPSRQWKYKVFGQTWFDGDTLNMAIGQGFLHVTPIGMCNFVAAIVNNGVVYRPHLVREIRSNDNSRVIKAFHRQKVREIPLSPVTLQAVKKGMRLGVMSGTSGRLSYLKVPVAGKTGTAQTRSIRQEKFSQHAWWIGYAPAEGPTENAVACAVLIEYGIAGAASALPIAERIFYKLNELGYFDAAPLAQIGPKQNETDIRKPAVQPRLQPKKDEAANKLP